MTLPFWPILLVDLIGSILMIGLSFACLRIAFRLRRREPDNMIWTYLQWLCLGLAGFAVSRSAGHILRQLLLLGGQDVLWRAISPYSGAFNTLMFAVVGSVTLYFETAWKAYRQIDEDKGVIQRAHRELLFLNQNLEAMVTERTDALGRSELKYRRIFEISRDMVLVAKPSGTILDANPACEANLAPRQEIIGRCFGLFFGRIDDWERLRRELVQNGFVSSCEASLRRGDGTSVMCLISAALDVNDGEEDDEGTAHYLVKDIEQFHRMEKQMAQADKLASIGEFSAGIAHEINNPLGIILGYTQLLLRREDASTERHGDLKTIEKHVRNCKAIVEDLLNFARSSPPEKQSLDIHAIIDDVVQFIDQHSRLGDVCIECDYAQNLPSLYLDEKKMRQVMMNLIMNACHAVGRQGTIRIETVLDAAVNHANIRIVDDGEGIAPKDLSRIFDPFFTTKPTGQGTGLGLSVSYGIVKNHGGDIRVQSRPGQGSVFTVTLPVSLADERKLP